MLHISEETGEATKVCAHCKKEKSVSEFHVCRRPNGDGYQSYCKTCEEEVRRAAAQKRAQEKEKMAQEKEKAKILTLLPKFSTEELQGELKKRKDIDLKAICEPKDMISALYALGYRGQLQFEVREIKTVTLQDFNS